MPAKPLETSRSLFNSYKFTVHPEGIPEKDIEALEKQLKITFPPCYRDFLSWMGKKRAGMLFGCEWLVDDLPGLKPKMLKTMAANEFPAKLPDDAFVFFAKQGEEFNFMLLSKGDDSPIYRYHTTLESFEKKFTEIFPNFEAWLSRHIDEHVTRMKSFGKPY